MDIIISPKLSGVCCLGCWPIKLKGRKGGDVDFEEDTMLFECLTEAMCNASAVHGGIVMPATAFRCADGHDQSSALCAACEDGYMFKNISYRILWANTDKEVNLINVSHD